MTAIEEEELVKDILATFMMSIEEWQSGIEGTPKPGETDGLDTIYDLTYQGLKNVFSQQHEQEIAEAQEAVVNAIQKEMGWEQSRDHFARQFGLPDKYSHKPGKCTCANSELQQQSNGGEV